MKNVLLVVVVMVAANAFGQDRLALREPTTLRLASDTADDPRPWLPMASWGMSTHLLPLSRASNVQSMVLRVRLVTTPKSPDAVPRPDRPFGDVAFLALHPRYSSGSFTVKIFRVRDLTVAPFQTFCVTQTLSVLAQPNQDSPFIVDLSQYGPNDSLAVEYWPGYDMYFEIQDGSAWRLVSAIGAQRGPRFAHSQGHTGPCN